jgi:myo-inositol-1(or 4)-monophosphatase
MSDYLQVAIEVAKNAGQYLLTNRGQLSQADINEKARNDFVTNVDHQSEKMIVEGLLSQFPDHMILAEEGGSKSNKNAEHRWIIDPLDGTKNFIQNIPVFSISIALEQQGKILVGVIYDPIHDDLFTAERGKGAYCNGSEINVSRRPVSEAMIATGFPFKAKNYLPQYLLSFEEIFLKCSGIRRMGSAALDLCYTAMGKFEGFWELGLSIWDMAAGSLLVEEAGGVITDFAGKDRYLESGFLVCGNSETHRELLKIVSHHFQHNISGE